MRLDIVVMIKDDIERVGGIAYKLIDGEYLPDILLAFEAADCTLR